MHPPPPELLLKQRRLGFLLWQLTSTTFILLLLHLFTFTFPSSPLPFLFLQLSSFLLHLSLQLLSHPHPQPHAPLTALAAAIVRAILRILIGGFEGPCWDVQFRRKAGRTLAVVGFLVVCAVSGFIGMAAVGCAVGGADWWVVSGVCLRGVVVGLGYGVWYLHLRRWLLRFPLVQRSLFFSLKMGLSSSFRQAMKLSVPAFLCSVTLGAFLPSYLKFRTTFWQFFIWELRLSVGTFIVMLCWEVSDNLLQVLFTRRYAFAPIQGSAAAGNNPSEPLLEYLEQCSSTPLLQHLAYLDLCIVSESNVEPWRRAAFFEETGETYRRIIAACLKPLEQLTFRIAEVLESYSKEKSGSPFLTHIPDPQTNFRLQEAFDNIQLYTWSTWAAAALTSRSYSEDRYGVAQLTGCNSAVVTTLLSCLLAVESCMGKKTSFQPEQSFGPGSIRWATTNTANGVRTPGVLVPRKKSSMALHAKAYAMADILRSSLYEIISAFESDMHANLSASAIERNWIRNDKQLYGTKEILVQKLLLFLEFRAC